MSDYEHIVTALSSIGATHSHYFGVCGKAIDTIESLERENEELRTDRDNWKGWKQKASQAAERLEQENAELRAKQMTGPAITPEMRERIEATVNLWDLCQRDMNADLARDFAPCAMDLLRDLLGEHGGSGDE